MIAYFRSTAPLTLSLAFFVWMLGCGGTELPTYRVDLDDFTVTITETGELQATSSVGVSAPRIRTRNLQIVQLAEKGSIVEKSDTLIVFDGTEMRKAIDEAENKLEIARANRDKSLAGMASSMAALEASLQNSRAGYRLAELRLEQMQFEAEVKRQEVQLQLEQASINLEQAEEKIEQQKKIDDADRRTLDLQVRQAEADLEKAQEDYSKLTVQAPQPGLVVYKKIWKGGDFSEVQVGDQPWPGQSLIELPDLSQMEVLTSVSEVDVSRVKPGQKAAIVLDAFPERTFQGEVTDVATLARLDESSSGEVKVFDVEVTVHESDPILKPGMTVSATIIVDEADSVLSVPLDAVFTEGENQIVYKVRGGATEVVTGLRNDNFVIIEEGLEEDDLVYLVDPNKPFDEEAWSGGKQQQAKKNGGNGGGSGKKGAVTVIQN